MKKILMGVLIAFLLLITILMMNGRVSFGNSKILGIEDIKQKSEELDEKIAEVSKLTSVTYPQKYNDLNAAQKAMLQSKQDYEDKLAYSTENEIESANRLENYNIDFLWTKIGKYATKQGLGLKLEIQNGSAQELKNLVFTATGKYIPITDFVYSLEDDEELNFVIENFKLVPNNSDGSVLQASFTVSDVAMNSSKLKTTQTSTTEDTTNSTNSNTNNSTTTNSSTSNATANNTTNNTVTTNNTANNNTTSNNTVTNNT